VRNWPGVLAAAGAGAALLVAASAGALPADLTGVLTQRARSAAAASGPPLPEDLSATPLAAPAQGPAGEGGYAVLGRQPDGEAVRWDPCRPVRYVVDSRTAPAGGDFLLRDALARVQQLTGLVFVDEGPTGESPDDERSSLQPERYGQRWAPVLVSWSDPAAATRLAGDVAGYAGPQRVPGAEPGTDRYVSGQLVLDGPQLAAMAGGQAGLARARAVVLHELAHLVGLDHVDDPGQLMYPATTPLVVDFADGDLRGLAAVSGGRCFRDF
jgi:hypothetical protein